MDYNTYTLTRTSSDSDASDSDEIVPFPTWTSRRIGLIAFGLQSLAICGIATTFFLRGRHAEHQSSASGTTARMLFQSDDMITTQARNLISILSLHDDEATVRLNVARGIKRIENEMETSEPLRWEQLNQLVLSQQQKQALLRVVSSMGDPRVQRIGYKVAKACSEGRKEGREGVKSQLNRMFDKDELLKVRKLRNELFRGLHRVAPDDTAVTFDADSMRLVQSFPDNSGSLEVSVQRNRRLLLDGASDDLSDLKDSQNKSSNSNDTSVIAPGSMGTPSEIKADEFTMADALGFMGGLEEQARVFLDQIDFVGQSFGWDSKIPSEAKSSVAGVDFATNVADCVERAQGNDVKEGMCPFKYGAAFFDTISCIDNMMGLDGKEMGLTNTDGGFFDTTASAPSSGFVGALAPAPGPSVFDQLFGPSPTSAPQPNLFNWN